MARVARRGWHRLLDLGARPPFLAAERGRRLSHPGLVRRVVAGGRHLRVGVSRHPTVAPLATCLPEPVSRPGPVAGPDYPPAPTDRPDHRWASCDRRLTNCPHRVNVTPPPMDCGHRGAPAPGSARRRRHDLGFARPRYVAQRRSVRQPIAARPNRAGSRYRRAGARSRSRNASAPRTRDGCQDHRRHAQPPR